MIVRSLYAKLAAVLLVLFMLVGMLALGITLYATDLYQQEANQKLNRELAQHIVDEKRLIRDKLVDQAALEDVFHMLMVINPAIELYLLNTDGRILAYSAEPGKVQRDHVDLTPVRRWVQGGIQFPMLGDDPRDQNRKKAFSAAAIKEKGNIEGYLYVILAGENYDSVTQMLTGSYILSASAWIIAGGTVLAVIVGLLLFAMLTGKLQRLARAMAVFKSGELPDLGKVPAKGDEIDRLTSTFLDMATQIDEQTRRLAKTDQMRRELVADVSHDLRTPLATLQGYIETLLIKDATLTGDERRQYLEIAVRHCHHLNKLVSDLLELARLDALEIQPHCEAFSLAELVQDIVQKYRLRAQEKDITIEAQLHSDLPFVRADIALIERALENLIENALRYTPAKGQVQLSLEHVAQGIRVQVRDTGCGIPDAELPRIFDRFYQLDKSRNSNPGATGLGLSIAKRILELHGSAINVTSALMRGTTFSFQLPAF
ncbi:MAG: HAMP domain-containing histidine kinase [Gammaproteobacteria bacterium]|nr:HAMP domain-containing histidine kinase [Gammaproteobacteria bacterium]